MKLFAQIQKVDEEKRLVFGRAADETEDKSAEKMDYDASKPHFMKWSEDMAKDTDGKNLGNVRAMHGKVAVGKLTDLQFDDHHKTIDVCAKVVDDNEWKKVLEGVYTGFSIGGAYGAKTVEKLEGREVTRYVAIPNEISLVDRPCNPTAKFFQVQKVDGSIQDVEFKESAPPVDEEVEVAGTSDEIIAFGKLMNDNKLSMADVIGMVKAATEEDPAPKGLEQGVWDKMTDDERKAWKAKAAQGKEPDGDEGKGGKGDGDGDEEAAKVEAAKAEEALVKLEAALADPLVKIGARNSHSDSTRIKAIHDAVVELGAECSSVTKDEPTGDLSKADQEVLSKALEKALEPLNKALQEANAKIEKLEAQPAAPKVSLRAVTKAADNGQSDVNGPTEDDLVKDAQGTVHPAASLIKQAQQSGGQPLYRG